MLPVGLLFLIPSVNETLRINGKAEIIDDIETCRDYAIKGRAPKTITKVIAKEVFLHCGKAPLRGGLWKPETWSKNRPVPNLYEIIKDHAKGHDVPQMTDKEIESRDTKTLY